MKPAPTPESKEEACANAALIAAAPEYYIEADKTLKLSDEIVSALLTICANCHFGRKCNQCKFDKVMLSIEQLQKRYEELQKRARGEK